MPLAYYYGYQNPAENLQLYKLLTSKLAQGVKARSAIDDETRLGGQIIDTTGLIDNVGYDIIQHAIDQFSGKYHLWYLLLTYHPINFRFKLQSMWSLC